MSWPALITSIVLTILLASPFRWVRGAGGQTFVRREPSSGQAYVNMRHPFYLSDVLAFAAVARALRSRIASGVPPAHTVLFVVIALHDGRTLARSPLADDDAACRRRVGLLLLLPSRVRA